MASTNDSVKLEKHLKLLKEEYTKLQKNYAELERKYSKAAASSDDHDLGEFSSFVSRLVMTVATLYGRKTYSDITVKLKDKTMPAHKFVLNARSEEWREEVIADKSELDWSDLDADVGYALLRWIYTDVVDLQHDSLALDLLKTSHRFKLPGLMGLCERALVSSVSVRSCVRFYCVAEEVGAANLLEYCSGLISTHWDDLTPQDFEHMSGPLLYNMLKSKTKHPLHAAVRLLREDVVFLCLVENDGSLSEIVNSLSPQGQLPLGLALMGRSSAIAQTLLETGGADINAFTSEGCTLLIDAIKRGDGFTAQFLLDKGCNIDLVTRDTSDTALHLVCTYAEKSTDSETFRDMLSVGRQLLKRRADPNVQNMRGYTPLHIAITSQHVDMIDELLNDNVLTLDTNIRTLEEKCALQFALMPPHTDGPPFDLAGRLLEKGARPNPINSETGDSLIHTLAKSRLEEAAMFLAEFANLNHVNKAGLTPLHVVASQGLSNLARALLEKGASPNLQSVVAELKTALHYAVESNSAEVIMAFIECIESLDDQAEAMDFNLKNALGDSPLSLALSMGYNKLVPLLIKGGADMNARNGQDMTLLHQAILKEDSKTAVFLLNHGADMNALTADQESPLQLAIHCRLPDVVDALCTRGVSFSAPDNKGDCPLWSALESEQFEIASVLVKHGVDTDCWGPGPEGCLQTLLHRAIDENKEVAAQFLIKSGCDLDSPRQLGPQGQGGDEAKDKASPLHLCCQWGLRNVLHTLIDHGANVNAVDCDMKTPLHVAIENQHEEIIGILLCHPGIDLKIRDKSGNTPFAAALQVRNNKAAQNILERLPNAAEQMDQRGRNFLHLAIMRDDLESVLFLLSIHVDVNSRVHDVNQTPPLHLAAGSENEMLIRNLILAGARLNDRDATQKTALHVAAERGTIGSVSALIQNGADFDAVDGDGNNALHIAVREGHITVVRVLLTESILNAEVVNLKGRNPLHELCRCGKDNTAAGIVELFLECMPRYPINTPDLQGNTPLLLAYMRGQAQLCRILVKNGACLGAENKEGLTIFNFKLATNQLLHRLLDELPQESPWASSELCQECGTKFTITMRKHHCPRSNHNLVLLRRMFTRIAMEKLVTRRNAILVQLKGELAAAEKLSERRASVSEATDRLEQLKELAGNFRQTQAKIEENIPDPEAIQSVCNYREEFSEAYYRAKDLLEQYIAELSPDDVQSVGSDGTVVDTCADLKEAMKLLLETQRAMLTGQQGSVIGRVNQAGSSAQFSGDQVSNGAPFVNVRLPAISVPSFSGERKNWRSFKDIFETTIHSRNDLKDSLKMQYLLSYVEGDAKRLISSFPISDANYKEAWEALTKFYDKKKYTVFALVREFVDQQAVVTATSGSLRKLVATSDEVVRQLNALGEQYNTRDPWLIHLLLEKLDKESRSLWAQKIIDVENPTFDDFLKFLDNRCDALETCTAFSRKMFPETVKKDAVKKNVVTEKKMQSLHSTAAEQKCAKCSAEHPIYSCEVFKQMDTPSKRELVKKARLCYNCLRPSHSVKFCASKSVCRNGDCKQRHHTLLCEVKREEEKKKPVSNSEVQSPEEGEAVINTLVAQVPVEVQPRAFVLPTAVIRVRGNDGSLLQLRALIDSGSEATLISEACVNKLGLPRQNGKVVVSGLGQQSAGTTRGLVKLEIFSRFNEVNVLRTSAYVMGKLTSTLPAQHCRVNLSLLGKQIQGRLADPAYNEPGSIDIILGSDVFLALLKPGQVKDSSGVPVAQNTIFGWIVSGNHAIYSSSIQSNCAILNLHAELDLNRTLRLFWEQEEVPKLQLLTSSEQAAVDHFKSTLTRDEKGRFIVRLPFDDSKPALGESLTPAIKRLHAMEKRFRRDPEFYNQYSKFLREYLELGHMEEIPANEVEVEPSKCFYLPHHAVVKADSTTTKLRVVFDASCASSSGVSLNDRLLAGPNVNQDLYSVFVRFRTHLVAFMADVEKMYRQVLVHPADRDFLRIVFRESEDHPIKHYRLCSVTYGTKCAPYLAIEAMKQTACDSRSVYPEASQRIELDTYVDDVLSGAADVQQARELKNQMVEVLESAGFHLRKWTTNCPELLHEALDAEQLPVDVKLDEQQNAVKALGIQWRPNEDTFSFKVSLSLDSENTKRQLLSDSSKLFDPYGWLSPVTIRIKILFQQLWLCDIGWDDRLPPAVDSMWTEIKQTLHQVEQVRIPRFIPNYNGKVQLHGFADASEAAYGAVVYARATDEEGNTDVNLLAAKTRVAPIKQVSLPRLELNAAALLADLMESIIKALSHLEVELWAWTDSEIVLQWLSTHPRKWKTYVANRTSAILQILPREHWNHVRSEDNPADCASRGLAPSELVAHPLWWRGPEWLNLEPDNWMKLAVKEMEEEDLMEVRKLNVLHTTTMQVRTNYDIEKQLLERRSGYTLIVRTLAYVNRMHLMAKKIQYDADLTPQELYDAKAQLARAAQNEVYKQELELLRKGKELPFKNKLSSLHPFLDSHGTMRVGGRLQNSSYSYDVKHPIILPREHRVTELLIRELHLRNLHAGPRLLTATVNQQYWVVGLQAVVRQVVQSCARCVRLKGKTANQLMGSLPASRIIGTRAFTHVGVDYAGPMKVHASCVRGVKMTKGYIVVFVCMATKAVHLEVASDLTTNVFIWALKRFISRRGYPNEIWSDCGTNFVGADRWMQELQAALKSHHAASNRFLTNLGIKWVFNPPSAPHRGGIWEAAVKSAKKHLVAVLGSEAATYEQLSTILAQVEACLNSRPLCPLSTDPDNCEALTPGHFLVGQPLNLIPEPGVHHIPTNRLDKFQLLHKETVEIWRRWRDEYLANLQPRTKWRTTLANMEKDQLVLVKNDNTPPAQWELARIVQLHPDSTGVVRTVTLRHGQAEYMRPIQKICVLPTD